MTDPERLADILATWHERRATGDVQADEILAENPELADELRASLETLEILDRAFTEPGEDFATPPRNIGQYRILHEIGRGGMGVVYEAEQTSMERRVALKVLSPAITNVARSIKRFKLEAKAAGRLHHTNIVPVHDMGQHGGFWYYAMELVEGRPLSQILDDLRAGGDRSANSKSQMTRSADAGGTTSSDSGLAWYRAIAAVFADVAAALELAHEEGIVHRDVKPSNLLLDADGTLKLVDFGLAHLEGNGPTMTRTGDLLGTPAYMSPEQAVARRMRVDHRTDIYSLGATLYEILTLRPPFEGDNLPQLCSQIVGVDPVRPKLIERQIPRDLETIVLKAMEKDCAKRYQHAGDLAQDLRAFCDGGAIRARRIGVGGRMWRRVKRHKLRTSLVAAVLVLAAGSAVLLSLLADAWRGTEYERVLAVAEGDTAVAMTHVGGIAEFALHRLRDESGPDPYAQAIEIDDRRPEAYWLRSLTVGQSLEARLLDIDAASVRGLPAQTVHRLKAFSYSSVGLVDDAADEKARAESLTGQPTATDFYLRARLLLPAEDQRARELLTEAIEQSKPGEMIHYFALRQRAGSRKRIGDFFGALEDLIVIQDAGDVSVGVRIRIASLWGHVNNRDKAEEEFDEAIELARASGNESSWNALALACHAAGEYGWMEQVSAEAVRTFPDSIQVLNLRLISLSHVGGLGSASELGQRALEIDPENHWAHYWNGRILAEQGRAEEAIEAYEAAIELKDDYAPAHYFLAEIFASRHQHDRAVEHYQRVVDLEPQGQGHNAHHQLGLALGRMSRLEEAIEVLQTAAELHFTQSHTHYDLGRVLFTDNRFEDAITAFEQAVELDPGIPHFHEALGDALKQVGRIEEAVGEYREVVDLDPDNWQHRNLLGLALRQQGDHAQALEIFRKARELAPDASNLLFNLGWQLNHADLYDEAAEVFRHLLELTPQDGEAWLELAIALQGKGDIQEALGAYTKAIALRPDTTAYYNYGTLLFQQGLFDESITAFEQAIQRDETHAEAHGNIGVALMSKGEFEAAIPYCIEQIRLDPDNTANPNYNLACLYALTGDVDQAFISLRAAAKAGFRNTTHMEQDAALASLRKDPRYKEILALMKGKGER